MGFWITITGAAVCLLALVLPMPEHPHANRFAAESGSALLWFGGPAVLCAALAYVVWRWRRQVAWLIAVVGALVLLSGFAGATTDVPAADTGVTLWTYAAGGLLMLAGGSLSTVTLQRARVEASQRTTNWWP